MEAREASFEEAFNEAEDLDIIQFENISGLESVAHLREHLQDTKRWTEAVLLHGSEDNLYALHSDFHAKYTGRGSSKAGIRRLRLFTGY